MIVKAFETVSILICILFTGIIFMAKLELAVDFFELNIKNGDLLGKLWKIQDRTFKVFLGIPYAEPPLHKFNLRFEKPVPKQPWSTSRSATKFEPACLQFMDFHHDDKFSRKSMARESEDCLYLNVFAPHTNNTPAQKYPVLVWIHGGSFLAGSGDTGMDPMIILKRLVSKDVILVTLNYRLGALGFFSSISPDLRGNLGLWDQIEALKWVQQNIEYFGGDSTKVTLIGESAGAASVSLLAISPVVRSLDLAHRAIIMSGSSGAGWALERRQKHEYDIENLYEYFTCEKLFNRDDLANIFRGQDITLFEDKDRCNLMSKPLQCSPSDTVHDLLKCFREKANFSDPHFRKAFAIELGVSKPIVDDEIIPYNVEDLLRKNAKIPIMIGIAEDEWGAKKLIYYSFKAYRNMTNETIRRKIWSILEQSYRPSIYSPLSNRTMDLLIDAIVHYYIGSRWSNQDIEMKDFGDVLQNIEADIEFLAPCYKEAAAYSNNNQNVYLYSFEHVPKNPIYEEEFINMDLFGNKRKIRKQQHTVFDAAFHGLDHSYIFTKGYTSNFHFQYDKDDAKISNYWTKFITNFAKYGNPTPDPVDNITWPSFTVENPAYLSFKLPLAVKEQEFYWRNVSFWTNYVPQFVKKIGSPDNRTAEPLSDDERIQLSAYKRAWWALWILVAAVAFVLWIIVICMVAQKCISAKSRPYKNIIVANG